MREKNVGVRITRGALREKGPNRDKAAVMLRLRPIA